MLTGCGALLRQLHELDPSVLDPSVLDPSVLDPSVLEPDAAAGVIRHGDFGPNNVLLDPATMAVTALLDWEFSGVGAAIEDIAWCEWIVRMHHPDAVSALPAFFDAYGWTPPWEQRRRVMLSRCRWLAAFCARSDPHGAGVRLWQVRAQATASWSVLHPSS